MNQVLLPLKQDHPGTWWWCSALEMVPSGDLSLFSMLFAYDIHQVNLINSYFEISTIKPVFNDVKMAMCRSCYQGGAVAYIPYTNHHSFQ